MTPQTLKLAPNVPVVMEIKYVDIYPNDTAKNNGKGYGSSVSLRGFVDGVDARMYPKGFTDRTLRILISADVIELGTYDDDPEEKYSIPVLDGKQVQLLMEQPAGERYAAFTALNLSRTVGPSKPGREAPKAAPTDDSAYADVLALQYTPQQGTAGASPPTTFYTGKTNVAQPNPIPRVGAVDRMRACIGAALTLANEAATIEDGVSFAPEDIRAIAISMYIDGHGR